MRTSWPGPRPATASSSVSRRAIPTYGSRLAMAARRLPPPARPRSRTRQRNNRTRDPVTSPPLPVPDRIARGQLSPKSWPQLFDAPAQISSNNGAEQTTAVDVFGGRNPAGKTFMPYTRPIRRFYLTPPAVPTFIISVLLAVLAV